MGSAPHPATRGNRRRETFDYFQPAFCFRSRLFDERAHGQAIHEPPGPFCASGFVGLDDAIPQPRQHNRRRFAQPSGDVDETGFAGRSAGKPFSFRLGPALSTGESALIVVRLGLFSGLGEERFEISWVHNAVGLLGRSDHGETSVWPTGVGASNL